MSLDHAHSPAVGTKQRADGASHHPPVRRRGVRLPAGRFWRVQLRATEDRTPPIGPEEVRPAIRRLVISDLHLGAGDALDEFTADEELAAFVRHYAGSGEPTELILGGDTFEFLQVLLPHLDDYEWSGQAAAERLSAILRAHPAPIAALREFVQQPGNQLSIIVGNHDFELHYEAAKQLLRDTLGLPPGDDRLRFGTSYEGGGVYIVHGNQFDSWNRFVYFDGICEPFEVVRGTRVVKDVINRLKAEPLPIAPLMDNVKPISALVWYMLSLPRLRDRRTRRFVARALFMLAPSLARSRRYVPPQPAGAASGRAGGPWRGLRRRGARGVAMLRSAGRRVLRSSGSGADAAAQIEREAGQQLQREMRAFRGDLLRSIARLAHSAEHRRNRLFVCGHTHLAQVVTVSPHQLYINTGTWTDVVLDVASGRRIDQRFPFLEITYPDGPDAPQGQLLVWTHPEEKPQPWRGAHTS
ncbi:MAG: metallophosphoesterase [Chloroflexota bacterium]